MSPSESVLKEIILLGTAALNPDHQQYSGSILFEGRRYTINAGSPTEVAQKISYFYLLMHQTL